MSLDEGHTWPEGVMDDRGAPGAGFPQPGGRWGEPAGVLADELTGVLHHAVGQAARHLHAAAAAVYLLTADGAELRAAMIGGSPPSVFTLPGRMPLDSPYASARALADGGVAFLAEPDPLAEPEQGALAYPYTVASVPLESAGRRFGSLTVLRTEDRGGYGDADCRRLTRIGDRLAALLAGLLARGATITPGSLPVLVPVLGTEPPAGPEHGILPGLPAVPGSTGLTLLYALQRLADMLNRATTMEHVTGAAEFCVMAPLRARALALASAADGRLWVVGHSGDSACLVRELHGSALSAHTPAARALRGRAPFFPGVFAAGPSGPRDIADDRASATAHLPLVGSRHVVDLPIPATDPVVGVCSLAFDGPRTFPPEERAVLTMMAGLLGSAVQRIRLSAARRSLAEGMQRRLLPAALAEVPRLTTTARYRPARSGSEAGGDWYDVITMPDGRVLLAVGDVEGHTMESALVMGQLRTAVAAYATEGHAPAAVLERTDRLLARLGTGLLATCCVMAVDTETGLAEVALAGHPAPLARLPDGTVRPLRAPANVPLGLHVRTPYRSQEHTLTPGSVLALCSAGPHGTDHDDVRARLATGGRRADTDLEHLADRLLQDTPGRRDDAALLLARYEGADDGTAPRTARFHVERRDLRAVGQARRFVHERLCDWGLADLSDDLVLITSELVTNALVHAGSDVDLRLRAFGDRVRLEVRDSDSAPPVPTAYSLTDEGSATAEHGRGLFLVDALAQTWNTAASGRGKSVWLELAVPGAARGAGDGRPTNDLTHASPGPVGARGRGPSPD
ncbi:SpoIIE family protein phosphatase (plasmid) [Streptomyces sp. FXJ1.172]|uniref:ATP-binding SpoIIE family protein phosphatase n=1 Tax=Streptomyces sp. FXJ1.172 TaxID=710705 RepID=UPI0023DD3667|nr:SpoIIE family protein phosphatase [Streptomyces sp. FXJ1.172]WEP00876.1 SpoIIE family protein phosphatase [Streptomyces sp. FXJ1.172]